MQHITQPSIGDDAVAHTQPQTQPAQLAAHGGRMQRSYHLWVPILWGVLAISFTLAILVGWSILFTYYYTLHTRIHRVPDLGVGYWFLLALGCLFLVAIIVAVIFLLIGNIRKTLDIRHQNVFLDGVTHEFKSPLASIRLCLETMEMRSLSPDLQKRFVQMMMKDVERLSTFVEHILGASRIEHGAWGMQKNPVILQEIVSRSIQAVRGRYEKNFPEIDRVDRLGTAPTVLYTDPLALETILINLLDNAIKYSPDPAHVIVYLEKHESSVCITVEDQGIGIPKRFLKRIFQRFYRIPREQTPMPRGTGLGLYVVASLVRRLGGSIQAQSKGEGQGSRFLVDLPCQTTPAQADIHKTATEKNDGNESIVEKSKGV